MIEQLKSWMMGLTGAAFLCALCEELTPEGRVKTVEKMICGVMMTLVLVSPLLHADFGSYSMELAKYREEAEKIGASAEEISEHLSRTFIEEHCAAYILDKAQLLGLDIGEIHVRARWNSEGYWYPVAAEIAGTYDGELEEYIEETLGIAAAQQHWSKDENN